MAERRQSFTILVADDDAEDRMLVAEAFAENQLAHSLRFVKDGEQLMDYLHHRGQYTDPESAPRPGLILLDLNMPRKDGRQALQEIKGDPALRQIPIVVLTTSRAEEDVFHSYDLGVSSFITKPVTFTALVELVKMLSMYWFGLVELPPDRTSKYEEA